MGPEVHIFNKNITQGQDIPPSHFINVTNERETIKL